jgi:hypothetical protein
VHCVIIGFGSFEPLAKYIFEYLGLSGEPVRVEATNINPYLVDAPFVAVEKRRNPLQKVKQIAFGNMPNDGGNLIFSPEEMVLFRGDDVSIDQFVRPLLGSEEFINGTTRYCLWLKDVQPEDLKKHPAVMRRIEAVRTQRSLSNREETKRLANQPALFW